MLMTMLREKEIKVDIELYKKERRKLRCVVGEIKRKKGVSRLYRKEYKCEVI